MNRLPIKKRVQIVSLLVEGMSMRSISRVAGVSINTATKMLEDVGATCCEFQDKAMRNLTITQVQVDEIWAFIGMKAKNVSDNADPTHGLGDCHTYTSIDPVTKLMPCWMLGYRDAESADHFMGDLKMRLVNRIQLSTDGMGAYPAAVAKHFGTDVDYAVIIKDYMPPPTTPEAKRRYSPNKVIGTTFAVVEDAPNQAFATAAHVERANLPMRMGMRCFTRLTNAFSKKIENHMFAVSLHFMHYNFARVHKSIGTTPAMKAGVASHIWSIEEIVNLAPDPEAKKRGPYKARQNIAA